MKKFVETVSNNWKKMTFGLVGLIIFINSFYVVPVGEEGVTSSFGDVHEEPIYGFNLVPFWYDVDTYRNQYATRTWDDVGVPSQDKFKTNMDISYTGYYVKSKGPKIRLNTGTAQMYLDTHVDKMVLSCSIKAGGTVIKSQAFFDEKIQKEMATYVADCVNGYISEEADGGYKVTEIQFTDIRLDPRVREFMVKTKEREEGEKQQESATRSAKEKSQIQVNEMQAQAEASAHAKTKRQNEADAVFYAKQKEAAENKLLARSITPELVEYMRIQQWDGKYPTHMLGEGTTYMMK